MVVKDCLESRAWVWVLQINERALFWSEIISLVRVLLNGKMQLRWNGWMLFSFFDGLLGVLKVLDCNRGLLEQSVDLKRHSYVTSFSCKVTMWWILIPKKLQSQWIWRLMVPFLFSWSPGCCRGLRMLEGRSEKRVWAWNLLRSLVI